MALNRTKDAFTRIIAALSTTEPSPSLVVAMSAQQLENLAHFPEAVIYPQTAAGLGALGNYAHGIVFFYGQVTLVQDALRRLPHDQPVISRKQLDNFAHALFNAAEAAMEALPAFPSQKWEAGDREFKRRMTVARQARDALPPPA